MLFLKIGLRFPRRLTVLNSTEADTGSVRLAWYITKSNKANIAPPPSDANTLLHVTLLAHEPFQRLGCDNGSAVAMQSMWNSTVLHCLLHKKEGALKQKGSRDIGTWQLQVGGICLHLHLYIPFHHRSMLPLIWTFLLSLHRAFSVLSVLQQDVRRIHLSFSLSS